MAIYNRSFSDFKWFVIESMFLSITCLFFFIWFQRWFFNREPLADKESFIATNIGMEGNEDSKDRRRINVLCLGIDSVEGTHRTDTILLLGIDLYEKTINVLSIPRDTRVLVGSTSHKLNEIYVRYGENVLRGLIEELLEIRIDRSVLIGFEGFIHAIDVLGGIDIIIDQPMHYDDNCGNVHIHFDPGPAHLDGKKALEFVRFRADAAADLGRIKRQQRFIAACLEKLRTPSIVMRLPQLLQEIYRNVHTDFRISEILDLAYSLSKGDIAVQTLSLPGDARYINKISYYLPYKDQAVAIGSKHYSTLSLLSLDASYTVATHSGTK